MTPLQDKIQLPPLSEKFVNIFLIRDEREITPELVSVYESCLSRFESQKYARFHFGKDRRLFLLSRALTRFTLGHYVNCEPREIRFETDRFGKPRLTPEHGLDFNLSHSGGIAVLAITVAVETDLGIDIEFAKRENDLLDLAQNYFGKHEIRALKDASKDQCQDLFFRFWTLKESYIKAIGLGLSIDLDSFDFNLERKKIGIRHRPSEAVNAWQFDQFRTGTNHLIALAIRSKTGNPKRISIHEYLPTAHCKKIDLEQIGSSLVN